ncbi:DMT family transporter [Bacillus sp. S13(2024)]|uniref:DMT family transporter n=1 Tax=unclassified Bacillus (in: firmicutes) TaxID=185979 RepID=UPI003D1CC73F
MTQLSRTKTVMLLSFLVLIWGINWPLSKFALHYTPPLLFAGIRTVMGGFILLIFALPKYKQLYLKKTWHLYFISALFNVILFYGLQTVGLQYMPAGLFTAIAFLQPVLLGIFSWIWLEEVMYGLKIFGLILGFAGVAVISSSGFTGHISIIGIFLALGCAIGGALGTVFIKRTGNRVNIIWMVTLQLIIGGFFLIGFGSEFESWSSIAWNVPFVIILLFNSIFVIAMGWLSYFTLVGAGEASKVGAYTFLIPLIAIIISSIFLHEVITISLFVGLLFIVVSICFLNIKPKSLMMEQSVDPKRY